MHHAVGVKISRLNKYGLCLEPNMKYPLLDDIGKQFIDHAAELVKAGHRFAYVLDNIDWEEKTHDMIMRQEVQNKSAHAVATSIVFNRVSDKGLPILVLNKIWRIAMFISWWISVHWNWRQFETGIEYLLPSHY